MKITNEFTVSDAIKLILIIAFLIIGTLLFNHFTAKDLEEEQRIKSRMESLEDSVRVLKQEIKIKDEKLRSYEEKKDSIREHNAGIYVDYVNTLSVINQMAKEKKVSKEIAKRMEEMTYQDHVRKLIGGEKDKEITIQELNLIRPNF